MSATTSTATRRPRRRRRSPRRPESRPAAPQVDSSNRVRVAHAEYGVRLHVPGCTPLKAELTMPSPADFWIALDDVALADSHSRARRPVGVRQMVTFLFDRDRLPRSRCCACLASAFTS